MKINILKFWGILNIVFPSILLIILAIARTNGVIYPDWVLWILGLQIFLGAVLLSIKEENE